MHMGAPPGYAVFFPRQPLSADAVRYLAGDDTVALWESMSAEARVELIEYYYALHTGQLADRVREEVPCLWLDPLTRRCRHYEDRPPVCREFQVGSAACHRHRAVRGLPIPGAIPSAEDVRKELVHSMAEATTSTAGRGFAQR